jgi:hypothetical protein
VNEWPLLKLQAPSPKLQRSSKCQAPAKGTGVSQWPNPKSEGRNPKEIRSPKPETTGPRPWPNDSDFRLRISSDLGAWEFCNRLWCLGFFWSLELGAWSLAGGRAAGAPAFSV